MSEPVTALISQPPAALMERPDQIVARIKQARAIVVQIQREIMIPGTHYGTLPGTQKPVLLKEGADVLNMAFRITPREEEVLDLSGPDEKRFKVTVGLYDIEGRRLGFGVGICSTSEDKYKWRKAYKADYEAVADDRRRKKAGEKDGRSWETLQVRTEPADLENTVLQMAVKRALVQATRQVHAVSDIFADITVEDLPEELRESLNLGNKPVIKKPQAKAPQQPATPKANGKAATGAPTPAAATGDATKAAEHPPREPGEDDEPHAFLIPPEAWAKVKAKFHNRGMISDKQSKRLFAIAYENGWGGREVAAEIQAGLGIEVADGGLLPMPWGDPYDMTCVLFATPRPQV